MKMKLQALISPLIALCAGPTLSPALQPPVPVPQTTLVPVTLDSYPFGAADHLNVPEDLSKVGYLEEEYLISGTANVYDWPAPGTATVRVANAPYTTRMLVRRPIKRERLSGNVIVEILNATNGVDLEIGWALSKEYLVRNGDVWIGFTSKPVTADALQKFNPTRYASLNWANPVPLNDPENCTDLVTIIPGDSSRTTENGLLWDIYSQIAAWARSNDSLIPIHRTQFVYGYGYSQSGFDLQTYIDAVHPLAKQAMEPRSTMGFSLPPGLTVLPQSIDVLRRPLAPAPGKSKTLVYR
jgi:Alpha/beta hydrolase domain